MAKTSKKKKKKANPKKNWLKYGLLLIVGLLLIGTYLFFGPNTGSFTSGDYLYIHTGSDYKTVRQALVDGHFIKDIKTFDLTAKQAALPENIHPGKYQIKRGMSNYTIVKMLRAGTQTPVKLVIKRIRTQQDFITLIGTHLEADSTVLKTMLLDTVYLAQFGLDAHTAMCGVMPGSYEFSWNTTADKAFRKIEKNYALFWTDERKKKAGALNLTPQQVIIMASIVEEETNKSEDKPKIASVYLNRINKGIKLQADPTARFAYGDFTIRRITTEQTSLISPYNTYHVSGLPPGPICTPSAASIDAVLAAPKNTYLYFCAKEDRSGYSRFASTYTEHMKNARLYQASLNRRNIH